MRRLGIIAVVAAAGASCSPAPNLLPVNDLNRPTDVAFMCFGAFAPGQTADGGAPNVNAGSADGGGTPGPLQLSGRPMRSCHPPTLYDPPASASNRTFAFLTDSASGGLTMVDADNWKLVDLNTETGGYGQLPLGQLPMQISVSDDGCRLISANRGSCDLTLVDPSVLVAPVVNRQNDPNVVIPMSRTAVATIRPLRGDGTSLVAAPYEAVFLPQDTSQLEGGSLLCAGPGALSQAGPSGWGTPAGTSVPWYALVTYPSCDLIVLLELPSGKIVRSVHARQVGQSVVFEDAGTSPVCKNSDCAGQSVTLPDAGAAAGIDAGPEAGTPATVDAATDTAAPSTGTDAATDAAGPSTGSDAGAGSADAGGPAAGAFPGIQHLDVPYFGVGPLSPSSIAIVPDGSRAYVSLSNASFVASIGIASGGLTLPANAIYLHEGARGSNRIRLNVDPYASTATGFSGKFVGTDPDVTDTTKVEHEYLYVIAKDGTLRVVQIFNRGAERECETNPDPLNLAPGITAATPCIPVDPAHRRPFSVGPGIHFRTVPIDVAAADIQAAAADPNDTSEQSVYGAHAWVLTSSGIVYLVNIDPVRRWYFGPLPPKYMIPTTTMGNIEEQQPFENTLRDRNEITYSLTLDPSSGPPRVDVLPGIPAIGPYIEPFWTQGADPQGAELNATALTSAYVLTDVFFPKLPNLTADQHDTIDRRAVTPQSWSVTWEGGIGGTRNTGQVMPEDLASLPANGSAAGQRGSRFQDGGANYCSQGVLPGDLVTLSGCTVNGQCGLGEGCLVDTTVTTAAGGVPVTGICVDPNRVDAQSVTCVRFIDSVRRYEVVAAYPSELIIRPHLDELVLSGLTPCHPPDATNPVPSDCIDKNDPSTNRFTCETVYPTGLGTGPRCLMKGCKSDNDCRSGRNCVDFAMGSAPSVANCGDGHCFCADAPPLDKIAAGCFDQLIAYQVSVGNGFLVSGSQSGLITTASTLADGSCSLDPTPDPRFTFRIPMNAPACTNMPAAPADPENGAPVSAIDSRTDPETVSAGDGMTFVDPLTMVSTVDQPQQRAIANANILAQLGQTPPTPDPCLYFGGPAGTDPQIDPTLPLPPAGIQRVRARFRNSQISFVLANIDREPIGQFQTTFDVHGGFTPQVVQTPTTVEISMPARIVLGPVDSQPQVLGANAPPSFSEQPYLFVVDQRRLGRGQGGGPTRGQLLRIHPVGFTSSIALATGLQPIFQDYTASGGLFPIQ
jgi:hypothetical protein